MRVVKTIGKDFYNIQKTITIFRGILSVQSMLGLFMPLSGFISQRKYLPIIYMPLTISSPSAASANDPIISADTAIQIH